MLQLNIRYSFILSLIFADSQLPRLPVAYALVLGGLSDIVL